MKLKLNLDKKTIQDFLLQNVEKIVFGIIVVVMLLMLYSSFQGAGRFERTPEQLLQAVTNGEKEMERTPADSVGLVVADYATQAKQSRAETEEKPYSHMVLWDKPLFDKRPLRDTPALFAAQKLRGASGVGAFRTAVVARTTARKPARPGGAEMPAAGNAAGETLTGKRWVVVTGLVPIEKQEAAYHEAFKQSVFYDPQTDAPAYIGYWVERLEVLNSGDVANLDWEKATKFMSKTAIETAEESWGVSAAAVGTGKELVPEKYLEEKLVFPLGPLVNQTWGSDVAHEPEIPARKLTDRGMGMAAGMMNDRGMPPVRGRPDQPMMGAMDGGRERGERITDDTPFGDAPAKGRLNDADRELPNERELVDDSKAPSYKLFRFFDFTVEPGKRYVYRVCLALQNPNRGLKTLYLKAPELADLTHLKTKWSDPTPVVSVPRDTRILAVSVDPARSSIDSFSTILVTKWINRKGIEAFVEQSKIGRGQLCNFAKEKFRPPTSARRTGGGGDLGFGPTSTRTITVDFLTGATMVDLRGGERLPGKKGVSAGQILVLDSDGTLFVRNELDDYPTYEKLTGAGEEPAADPKLGPGMMGPGMMGPGMMGPGMMGPGMMGPGMPGRGAGLDAVPAEDRRGRR